MPTSLRVGPYRFFFYAGDRGEPPHTHIERDDLEAKFWLQPVILAWNHGFSAAELRKIQGIAEEHQNKLLTTWHDYFTDSPG